MGPVSIIDWWYRPQYINYTVNVLWHGLIY